MFRFTALRRESKEFTGSHLITGSFETRSINSGSAIETPILRSARRVALAIGSVEKPCFKLNNHLKEALQEAVNKAYDKERQLRDEEKVAQHQKRLIKKRCARRKNEETKTLTKKE